MLEELLHGLVSEIDQQLLVWFIVCISAKVTTVSIYLVEIELYTSTGVHQKDILDANGDW